MTAKHQQCCGCHRPEGERDSISFRSTRAVIASFAPQQQRHEQQRQHHHSNHHPYIFIFSDIRSLKQHIYICNHCNHIHIFQLTYIRASLLTCVLTYTYIHSGIHTNLHIHRSICIKMMCVCSYLYFMNTHTHIRTVLKLCHRHRPLSGHGS